MIRYAIARCSLGWVLVGANDKGLCSIELGDSPGSLRTALQSRFPNATLAQATDSLGGKIGRASCRERV